MENENYNFEFNQAVESLRRDLVNIAGSLTRGYGDPELAEEIAQDLLMKWVQKARLKDFLPGGMYYRNAAVIRTCCRNMVIDAWRRRRNQVVPGVESLDVTAREASEKLRELVELRDEIKRTVDIVCSIFAEHVSRELVEIMLRILAGFSMKKACEGIIRESTARSRFEKVRETFYGCMNQGR